MFYNLVLIIICIHIHTCIFVICRLKLQHSVKKLIAKRNDKEASISSLSIEYTNLQ